MMALHGLRILGDLAFYYAFAGFFAASFGGCPTVWVLLWPACAQAVRSCPPKATVLPPVQKQISRSKRRRRQRSTASICGTMQSCTMSTMTAVW